MRKSIKQINSAKEKKRNQKEKDLKMHNTVFHTYPEEKRHACTKEIKYIEDDGCWICTSHQLVTRDDGSGYVPIHRNGRAKHLHRYVWQLENGRPLKPGDIVTMTCGNHACMSPAHMRLGLKGRLIGLWQRKLKMSDAIKIRELYAKGKKQVALAIKFGVSQGTISNILSMKCYKPS